MGLQQKVVSLIMQQCHACGTGIQFFRVSLKPATHFSGVVDPKWLRNQPCRMNSYTVPKQVDISTKMLVTALQPPVPISPLSAEDLFRNGPAQHKQPGSNPLMPCAPHKTRSTVV